MKKNWTRWAPVAAVPALVAGVAVAVPLSAGAAVSLPEKSAQQVLELVAQSDGAVYSGTVEQTSDLGIPELPASGRTGDASSALELLTASHELRIFVGGPDRQRLQVLDRLGERNVIRNGDSVWLYSFTDQEATHLTLPSDSDRDGTSNGQSGADAAVPVTPPTPATLAQKLLDGIEPSTTVAVGTNALVAGRPAYELVLTPKSADTLVGEVSLSVDAETGLPLAVRISADGQETPAFETAFTSIDFSTPDAARFEFTPPSDATVTEPTEDRGPRGHSEGEHSETSRPAVTGEGWDAIVELPAGAAGAASGAPLDPSAGTPDSSTDASDGLAVLDQLTTPVDGGRVLETSLLSVLLLDDGRVLVGAVPADLLQAAAAQ